LTDQQFAAIVLHLRILIVLLGFVAGILIAFAWYCDDGSPTLSAALDHRGKPRVLRCKGRSRAGARLFLFRGRARPAAGDEAAHPGRGVAHGGKLRQAARAVEAARTTDRRSAFAGNVMLPAPIMAASRRFKANLRQLSPKRQPTFTTPAGGRSPLAPGWPPTELSHVRGHLARQRAAIAWVKSTWPARCWWPRPAPKNTGRQHQDVADGSQFQRFGADPNGVDVFDATE
jgi:hypothetical protein